MSAGERFVQIVDLSAPHWRVYVSDARGDRWGTRWPQGAGKPTRATILAAWDTATCGGTQSSSFWHLDA